MKPHNRTRGQALLEFAFAFPIIILIIILFIELGRVVYFYATLNNAVREGSRYVIVHQFSSSDDRLTKVQKKVADYAIALPLNLDDISVYCKHDPTNTDSPCEDSITVAADVAIEPMIPFFAQMINGSNNFEIKATSTMQTTPYGNIPSAGGEDDD